MKTLDASTRIQVKNILFATDLSPASAAAMPYAGRLAKLFGAELFALHVRTPVINPMTPPAGWPALEKAARLEAEEQERMLRNALPEVNPSVRIEEGDIWFHLKSMVERYKIDLVVVGSRGRNGVSKLLLGSGAEEILRDLRCPVLTIGPEVPAEPGPQDLFTHILYATSFATQLPPAAAYAFSLAREFQAELTLLHVVEDSRVGDLLVPQELMEPSKLRLQHLLPAESEAWCAPTYCVERGDPAEKILDVANRRRADLIVLGAHPSTGVPGASTHLPISVAHKVISHAHCPVMTLAD